MLIDARTQELARAWKHWMSDFKPQPIVFLAYLAEYVVIVRRFIWMKVVRFQKASQHRKLNM